MHVVLWSAVVALLVYFSPAPTDETVVLLPGPDGKVGVVIVERGGERTVLDTAYAVSRTATTRRMPRRAAARRGIRRRTYPWNGVAETISPSMRRPAGVS